MSSLADDINYIIEQSRQQQAEKTASAENLDPALDKEIPNGAGLSGRLKIAAQGLRSMSDDVSVDEVQNFAETFRG